MRRNNVGTPQAVAFPVLTTRGDRVESIDYVVCSDHCVCQDEMCCERKVCSDIYNMFATSPTHVTFLRVKLHIYTEYMDSTCSTCSRRLRWSRQANPQSRTFHSSRTTKGQSQLLGRPAAISTIHIVTEGWQVAIDLQAVPIFDLLNLDSS